MKMCIICNQNEVEEAYSYDDYLNELHTEIKKCSCRECKERLRAESRVERFGEAQQKVEVNVSHYQLPGFELSDDGTFWIRSKDKNGEKK